MHETREKLSFGSILRAYRTSAGLTQEQLAERAGLSRRGIADLERGARRAPYTHTLERLRAALGLSQAEYAVLVEAARPDSAGREGPEAERKRDNLPLRADRFIGREADRTRTARLLESPDSDGTMLFRYLYLVNEPESFQIECDNLPPTAFRCRRVVFDRSGDEQSPAWLHDLPRRPTVYATAGTSVNRTPGLLETFAAALADEPINAILTIGRDRDPAEFGGVAQNVHVEQYIPQSLVLSACDLVLSHCGSGTMYAALDHGLPMVNVPIGMDQLENAGRCAALRLGVSVRASALSADALRAAVRHVLADAAYRQNAQRMQRDMHALPGPGEVVALLERLAVEKRPYVGIGAVACRESTHA